MSAYLRNYETKDLGLLGLGDFFCLNSFLMIFVVLSLSLSLSRRISLWLAFC
jgi:hypothetical protein